MESFYKRYQPVEGGPTEFRGGVVTNRPRPLIPYGAFSVLQNVRGFHPGFKKRDGQTKFQSTSELATKIITCPAYKAGLTTYANAYGYDTNAAWATLRADASAANFALSTDHANSLYVSYDGATFTLGRTLICFDLSRYAGSGSGITGHVGDIATAKLYVKLNGNVQGSGVGSNEVSIIAMNAGDTDEDLTNSPLDLNQDTTHPFAAADWGYYITQNEAYSAEVVLDGETDGTWIAITLNAACIADIEAAAAQYDQTTWGDTSPGPYIAIALVEYDHDYSNSAPGSGETYDAQIHLATAANLPYLELTMTTPEEIVKLYQWSKGKRDERHFFAQHANGDLYEASSEPPTATGGDFGSLVHRPRQYDDVDEPWPTLKYSLDNLVPASFGSADDNLIYSDGMSQHMIYTGEEAPIETFKFHFDGTVASINTSGNAETGLDYSFEVTDGDPDSYADVSSMGDWANDYDAIFIKTKFKAKKLNFKFYSVNTTSSTLKMKYWSKTGGWTVLTITDGTNPGSAAFGQDGSVTWTPQDDEIEFFNMGENGYWYMVYLDSGGDLDSDTKISEVTYEGEWQELENVWNGVFEDALEVYVYDISITQWYYYPAYSVDLNEAAANDKILISSRNNLVGIHCDVGATPNLNSAPAFSMKYHDGTGFQSLTITEGTNALEDSGFITWKRQEDASPCEQEGSTYAAYWWEITIGSGTMSEGVKCTFKTMPFFRIKDLGAFGTVSTVWKERGVYAFNRFPSWLYVSENNEANRLNGADYAVLQAGDGRRNAIVAMQKFHNELMVWQEEKGRDGGCLTLFEGYNPSTFGKLLLSAKIGSFSQKSVVVIDGANSYTKRDANVQTLAFFISRYGIFVTDGSVVTRISDDIQNYFDPRFDECIRKGYEKKMYVEHDTSANVLRFGLVSGSLTGPGHTSTFKDKCNVFPVFDLIDWTWSFDELGQEHSHVHEVEAATGDLPVLQYAAAQNGYVYKINDKSTDQDDSTNIDMQCRPEFNAGGKVLAVSEVIVRGEPVASGNLSFQLWEDGEEHGLDLATIDMTAPKSDDGVDLNLFRERIMVDGDQHSNISLSFANAENNPCYLYDYIVKIAIEEDR